MKIYMATIEYENGTNFYAAHTEEELKEKIYRFVQMSWYEIFEIYPGCPADKDEAIEVYFGTRGDEYVTFSDEYDLPEPVTSMADDIWAEFDIYYYGNEKFMDALDETLDKLNRQELKEVWNLFDNADGSEQRHIAVEMALEKLDLDPEDFDAEEL